MAAVSELFSEANENFVNENYQKAVELYTQALELDGKRDDIYCHRAQAYLQMSKLTEAAEDYDRALKLNENNNKAYVKKGSTLFQLDEITKALEVFQEGLKRFESDKTLEDWIQKCRNELASKSPEVEATPPAEKAAPTGPSKIKYNWYQTHTHVVVAVMVKNVKKESLSVETDERALRVSIEETENPHLPLDLTLAHLIDPQQTTTKILSTKVEIKLKKREGIQWPTLEGAPDEEAKEVLPVLAAPVKEEPPRYPTSSQHSRDWDKIAAEVSEEEKTEKLEGDAALNQFFQKIYADASDETKKAMMKSFTESGGTVLSTNWDEVGSKRVEVKPPDGMEFKKWES